MKKRVLLVHGGGQGAYEEDEGLAAALREALGPACEVRYPRMSEANGPDYGTWRRGISEELAALGGGSILAGHSLGASLLLKYLCEEKVETSVAGLFLIAPPYWGAEDWEAGEYELEEDFASKLPEGLPVFLYHSRDDEVVPFSHLALYAAKLPWAAVREFDGPGHYFEGGLQEVARDIQKLWRRP